jgi:hypothetical protein
LSNAENRLYLNIARRIDPITRIRHSEQWLAGAPAAAVRIKTGSFTQPCGLDHVSSAATQPVLVL